MGFADAAEGWLLCTARAASPSRWRRWCSVGARTPFVVSLWLTAATCEDAEQRQERIPLVAANGAG